MPVSELVAVVLSFAVAFALHPLIIRLAHQRELFDTPDGRRHHHAAPTPRLGGIPIFSATVLASAVGFALDHHAASAVYPLTPTWPGILIGASIVFLTGVVDDLRGLPPMFKLLAHVTAALVAVAYGFRVDAITFGGGHAFHLGVAAVPITVFWMVGLTNAFNLIDGVDGLAATCALIGLGTGIIVEYMLAPVRPLVVTMALFGAVLAFTRFNRSPAKIFLGDSGSTTLGFFLSIRLAISATDGAGLTYPAIALCAAAYPIFDTTISIARRWLRGHAFSRADGRHIHHQFLALGLSAKRTVELIGLIFAGIAVLGVSITFAPPQVTLLFGIAGAVLLLTMFVYGIRWLGYTEFTEFGASVASVVRNARRHVRNKIVANDLAAALSRVQSVEEVKHILETCAEELGFVDVSLETNLSAYGPLPSHRQLAPLDERPFRVDCPIAWQLPGGEIQEAVLRFWCEPSANRGYFGAERLAARITPAVQQWMRTHTPVHGALVVEARPPRGISASRPRRSQG
jgi:UDP-GlcNAc:undecaprenyl-phosphate/decaprenyl-phosphate GlcNAc-1-phosphate transferase